jgi:hypothetical protein
MFQTSIMITVLALTMVLPLLALESVNRGSGRGENKTPPKTQTLEFAATATPTEDKSPKRGEGRRE